jgi:hypothetical protein
MAFSFQLDFAALKAQESIRVGIIFAAVLRIVAGCVLSYLTFFS